MPPRKPLLRTISSTESKCAYKSKEHQDECQKLFEACKKGDCTALGPLLRPDTVNQADINNRHSSPLHYAAGFGRVDCVQQLLTAGADLSQADDGGLLPLHNAASFGHLDVAKLLLESGADPDVADHWGYTALHEAAFWGKADICVTLLQHGASAQRENADGKTPSDLADGDAKGVFTGDYRKKELLEAAKNGDEEALHAYLTPFNVNCHASSGRKSTPLHLACGYNRVNLVKHLLEKGADVQAVDVGGLVPLHNACSFGHLEVVTLLLEAGADAQAEDLWNFTPLHEAASKGRLQVVKLLVANGADPTCKTGDAKAPIECITDEAMKTAIFHEFKGFKIYTAARNGDAALLKTMLGERDANYTHPCTKETPLHAIARSSHPRRKTFAEMVIKNGCPINSLDKNGMSAFHLAAAMNACDVLEVLINSGVSISEVTSAGQTVLHIAAVKGNYDLCKRLLSYGLPTDLKDSEAQTAADLAENDEIREMILRHGFERISAVEKRCKRGAGTRCGRKRDQCRSCRDAGENGNRASGAGSSIPANRMQGLPMACVAALRDTSPRLPEELELLDAAKCGDLTTVKRIVETAGVNIDCKDFDGRESTPLHFAAGYNRVEVLEYLLDKGADIEARDTGWLVPLHNACAYGHLVVAEMLVKHGANVNAVDKWGYTPLHEAALKGKFEVCKLLLSNGADSKRKGRDGKVPVDVVKEGADDVVDLLRGDDAVLEAAKDGDVEKLRRILMPSTINCRDLRGRYSTPLHLASGYNNLEVARFLLESGAEVNLKDKGGLIPLHNASSFGHLEIAGLLIDYGAEVNQPDKWGFTPLHEAAQKGRTQICSLLLNNGANVSMKNNEGLTALDVAGADDTKELLLSVQPMDLAKMASVKFVSQSSAGLLMADLPELPDKKAITGDHTQPSSSSTEDEDIVFASTEAKEEPKTEMSKENENISKFLKSIGFGSLCTLFVKEQITIDVLAGMTHDDLKAIGIDAFGARFRLLKSVEKFNSKKKEECERSPEEIVRDFATQGTVMIQLERSSKQFQRIETDLNLSIVPHHDSALGGNFTKFEVVEIQKIINKKVLERYMRRRGDIAEENCGEPNEKMLYHGSPFIHSIVQKGFDERYSFMGGMFGAGIYFAENSSKSNQYVFGMGGSGCSLHSDRSCYICVRHLLLCRVALGRCFLQSCCNKMAHSPPGHHSVVGQPRPGGLNYPEYVIYRGEQAYPEYVIVYRIVNGNFAETGI